MRFIIVAPLWQISSKWDVTPGSLSLKSTLKSEFIFGTWNETFTLIDQSSLGATKSWTWLESTAQGPNPGFPGFLDDGEACRSLAFGSLIFSDLVDSNQKGEGKSFLGFLLKISEGGLGFRWASCLLSFPHFGAHSFQSTILKVHGDHLGFPSPLPFLLLSRLFSFSSSPLGDFFGDSSSEDPLVLEAGSHLFPSSFLLRLRFSYGDRSLAAP